MALVRKTIELFQFPERMGKQLREIKAIGDSIDRNIDPNRSHLPNPSNFRQTKPGIPKAL